MKRKQSSNTARIALALAIGAWVALILISI